MTAWSVWPGRPWDRISVWTTFFSPVQTGPGAHPASCTMGTRIFSDVKRLGRGVDHLLRPSAEVKEREQLYVYPPSWSSWSVPV